MPNITDTCPTCGGEGKLFRQLDVDDFVPVEVCPECEGREVVDVLCEECNQPFTPEQWKDVVKEGKKYIVYYHAHCVEE